MIKLIIWDLDDTLWQGTLADGDAVSLFEHRMEMIRAFNARGVLSSICSKNDFETAKAKLVELGVWDEFVFPAIAFAPKPQAIQEIIADMQLRAANTLFVDDNHINLNEVRFVLPEIQTLDITKPDADAYLAELLAAQKGTRSRVADYRILEAKKQDRTASGGTLSNEDFLRSCEIQACAPFCMETLDHVERIAEMINRSNQLNYTKSRVTVEELQADIINVLENPSLAVFAWDKYGDYGLVGFVMLKHFRGTPDFEVTHFVFSCRAMHMGLEQWALDELVRRAPGFYPDIPFMDHPSFEGRFSRDTPDWIVRCAPDSPEAIARLTAQGIDTEAPSIRVMWSCQSGGIAHFSALRSIIDFDSFPKFFDLKSFFDASYDADEFPPYLVYGAGIHYGDPSWGDLSAQIDFGVYEVCVQAFCEFVQSRGIEALIILPPEELSFTQYHAWMGLSLDRVRRFNDIWRTAFDYYSGISVAEIDLLHGPEEMEDVNHHRPSSLEKIAQLVDYWHAKVSANREQDTQLAA